MKKLILLCGFVLLALGLYAQPYGQVYSFAVDSTVDTETIYFTSGPIRSNSNLTIQLYSNERAATTAGSAIVQESINGTSWVTMTHSNSSLQSVTNDTATIVDDAVEIWNVPITYGYKYRLKIVGSGSNSTLHYAKMILKPNNAMVAAGGEVKAWTQDHADNTETIYFTTGRVTANGILSLQVLATAVSGTNAGSAYVQESLDGTSWKTLNQNSNTIQGMSSVAAAMHATTAVATLTTTSVSIWHIPVTYAAFYRIVVAQTGTSHSHYDACRLLK
jgi:hypothetical protein